MDPMFQISIRLESNEIGSVTDRLGERFSVVGYLVAALVMELIFWLVPKFVVSAIAVAFLGFFFGKSFQALAMFK